MIVTESLSRNDMPSRKLTDDEELEQYIKEKEASEIPVPEVSEQERQRILAELNSQIEGYDLADRLHTGGIPSSFDSYNRAALKLSSSPYGGYRFESALVGPSGDPLLHISMMNKGEVNPITTEVTVDSFDMQVFADQALVLFGHQVTSKSSVIRIESIKQIARKEVGMKLQNFGPDTDPELQLANPTLYRFLPKSMFTEKFARAFGISTEARELGTFSLGFTAQDLYELLKQMDNGAYADKLIDAAGSIQELSRLTEIKQVKKLLGFIEAHQQSEQTTSQS